MKPLPSAVLFLLAIACAGFARGEDVLLEHYDVFARGEVVEGLSYDTYRIPNIARANDGTLIAVAEARLSGGGDPGSTHIDLVYKRSLDGGRTWSAGQVLDRHPDTLFNGSGVPTNRTSAANSVTFVNRSSGRVWNLNLRLPHATPSASSQPGVDDMQTWARFSDDSGATWSTPTHIVGSTTDIPYEDFYPNLGSATQLSNGRLVAPATEHNTSVTSRSFALYSDDAGVTWHAGDRVDAGTNEAQIAELTDGRLLMTARQNGGGGRVFAISDDQGATWNPSFTGFSSTRVMEAVERYTQSGVNGETVDRLLHTIPVGGPVTARTNLEIMTATNEPQPGGPTFGANRRMIHAWAGYSDIVNIDGDEVGVFWERGDTAGVQKMTYTRFNRAFLEPDPAQFGLLAHEGFDYVQGRTLNSIDGPPGPGADYEGGFAPVNFSSRTDLDLNFTLGMDIGGRPLTIDPGLGSNDQASGVLGQIFTTESQAGPVTQITVQRAQNGSAGPPVFLHVYSDTDLSDGIDAGTFLGSSLSAEDLGPTDLGITTWAFDGASTVLSPSTEYLFAFANSAIAGDTTVARVALNVAPNTAGFAIGGNGFNSAWRSVADDLTNGAGASDVAIGEGNLVYTGNPIAPTGNHAVLDNGGSLARGLGVGMDLNTNQAYYASMLVTRSADSGADDASDEQLSIQWLDASANVIAEFGVNSDEGFFADGPGTIASTADDAFDPAATYLLVMKIVSQDDSDGSHFDQVFLKAFESGDAIPDFDEGLNWTLVGDGGGNSEALIDRLLITGGDSAVWSIDELRVGGDFGSVASGLSFTFSGDLNLDGVIDILDWIEFKANFGQDTSLVGSTGKLVRGDFDQSGLVDPHDFIEFVRLFDLANGAGAFATARHLAPEPTTLWLLASAAAWCARSRCHARTTSPSAH